MNYFFTRMNDDHFPLYEKLVRPEMAPVDYIDWDYYQNTKEQRDWQAWIMTDSANPDIWLGWYALAAPSPSMAAAVHVYGFVIFSAYRQGLNRRAHTMAAHLYKQCRGQPITASIRPDNTQALRLAAKQGFLPFDWKDPWVEMVKPAKF